MSGLAIILGIILVLVYVLVAKHINDKKIKEGEEELEEDIIEMVGGNPVKIEVLPYGTKRNPVLCGKEERVEFTVIGWADHKMTQKVDLKFTDVAWSKSCPVGKLENEYGITNTYLTPRALGDRVIYAKHIPTNISAKTRIKVVS
jgi:hypothetical protein